MFQPFLFRYLERTRRETNQSEDVNVGSVLHDAVCSVFLGRMLLFGFKVLPTSGSQRNIPTDGERCSLKYVVSKSETNEDASREHSEVWIHSTHQLPSLISYQTINPHPDQKYTPVVSLFKHQLACLLLNGNQDINIPRRKENMLSDSSYQCSIDNALETDFEASTHLGQVSLKLSCDFDSSKKASVSGLEGTKCGACRDSPTCEAISSTGVTCTGKFSTSCLSFPRQASAEGDVDETKELNGVSWTDSLTAAQSQHLSKTSVYLQDKSDLVMSFPLNPKKLRSTATESCLDESESLLPCVEPNSARSAVRTVPEKDKTKNVDEQLRLSGILDSFSWEDRELLPTAERLQGMSVKDEPAPQTDEQLHLPYSEGFDSFLTVSCKNDWTVGSKVKPTTESETQNAQNPATDVPAYSEELFSERQNTQNGELEETDARIASEAATLPDSEDLDLFLDGQPSEATQQFGKNDAIDVGLPHLEKDHSSISDSVNYDSSDLFSSCSTIGELWEGVCDGKVDGPGEREEAYVVQRCHKVDGLKNYSPGVDGLPSKFTSGRQSCPQFLLSPVVPRKNAISPTVRLSVGKTETDHLQLHGDGDTFSSSTPISDETWTPLNGFLRENKTVNVSEQLFVPFDASVQNEVTDRLSRSGPFSENSFELFSVSQHSLQCNEEILRDRREVNSSVLHSSQFVIPASVHRPTSRLFGKSNLICGSVVGDSQGCDFDLHNASDDLFS